MVARRTVALAAVVMAVAVVVVVVVGNYTVAKDEVKQQYKDHAEESVENSKEGAKSWAAWAKDRIMEGLGLNGGPAEDEDEDEVDSERPGKAEEITGNKATDKVGMGPGTMSSGSTQREVEVEVDDTRHCASADGVPKQEL